MKNTLYIIAIAGLLSQLTACGPSVVNKKPNYDPAKPQVKQIQSSNNGAIYQAGMNVGLFDDRTAREVGDVLTIELVESASSSASANTKAKKENSVDMPTPTLAGEQVKSQEKEILNNQVDAGRDFSGSGDSSQSHNFKGDITVFVSEVLPNRNLVVRGQKLVVLNQAEEYIRFSGIVRPEDIKPNNTVPSNRVANAFIAYGDTGVLNSANSMGTLGRFFTSPVYPF